MFAAYGITELAVYYFNRICAAKLPHRFCILADNFEKEDAEYVLRFLESMIRKHGLEYAVCGIKLGENAEVEKETLEALCNEYGNIIHPCIARCC